MKKLLKGAAIGVFPGWIASFACATITDKINEKSDEWVSRIGAIFGGWAFGLIGGGIGGLFGDEIIYGIVGGIACPIVFYTTVAVKDAYTNSITTVEPQTLEPSGGQPDVSDELTDGMKPPIKSFERQ